MKRRLVMILAVVAMVMGVMASASADGVSKTSLDANGWSCFDNSGGGGAGWHCSIVPIGDFFAGATGSINVMVFSSPDEEFLGTEILTFSSRDIDGKPCGKNTNWLNLSGVSDDLYACHHWHAGTA